ncbi:hypothetical protein JOL62DRAFT_553100 [Phyllosticta paracitricarpa]|uniref:Uncharacterized protein n=1 Tax=Phyllosticta paracitricarpa TaxID=2016321 RepID=A0ABR1NII6_9PEZI
MENNSCDQTPAAAANAPEVPLPDKSMNIDKDTIITDSTDNSHDKTNTNLLKTSNPSKISKTNNLSTLTTNSSNPLNPLNPPNPSNLLPPTNPQQLALSAEIYATLALYDDILTRIACENAELHAAHARIAASRSRMTRAFDDVAKGRQRMAGLFKRARSSPPTATQRGVLDMGGQALDVLGNLNLEKRRWDIMRRYEALYRERKQLERDVAAKQEKRRADEVWVQAMFSRVAEKGLFEAPVVVQRQQQAAHVIKDEDEGDAILHHLIARLDARTAELNFEHLLEDAGMTTAITCNNDNNSNITTTNHSTSTAVRNNQQTPNTTNQPNTPSFEASCTNDLNIAHDVMRQALWTLEELEALQVNAKVEEAAAVLDAAKAGTDELAKLLFFAEEMMAGLEEKCQWLREQVFNGGGV